MVVTIRNLSSTATVALDPRDVERTGVINGRTDPVLIKPTREIRIPDYEFRMLPDYTLLRWAGLIDKGLIAIYFDAAVQTSSAVASYGVAYRVAP